MTLGDVVSQLVTDMINTTVYSSAAGPDVDNRAKIIYQDPGLIAAIDTEFEKISMPVEGEEKAVGGDGEFENALAEMIDSDWLGAAEDSMSDDEYASYMTNDAKKTPILEPISEAQGAGLTKSALAVAKSPMSVIAPLMGILPHAALVLLALSLAPMIVDELKKPGSMLDVRWRRIMGNEFNALMERQAQWNAQIGIRQVYAVAHDQFLIGNGAAFSESNLRQVRESDQRIAERIDFTDHAKEFFR